MQKKNVEKKEVTVGAKEGIGSGIIGLGVLLVLLPSFSQKISDLDFINSDAFGILAGAAMVMGILVGVAGLAVILSKFDDES
ncbi:MAG TPA: hypothetical protein VIO36_10035 [Anaerolineaceae bacterium]